MDRETFGSIFFVLFVLLWSYTVIVDFSPDRKDEEE